MNFKFFKIVSNFKIILMAFFSTGLISVAAKAEPGDAVMIPTIPVQIGIVAASSPLLAFYAIYDWTVGDANKRYFSIARSMTINNQVEKFQRNLLALEPISARARMFVKYSCPSDFSLESNESQSLAWMQFYTQTVREIISDYGYIGVPDAEIYGKLIGSDDENTHLNHARICKRAEAMPDLLESMVKLNSAIVDFQEQR